MNGEQMLEALLAHLQITFSGVALGCGVGIAAASLIKGLPKLNKVVMAAVDLIQTVPTLAMLTFVMLLFGLSDTTVIAAIFLYSLFPIMRNTHAGLAGVDRGMIRAGKGIGMTPLQIYLQLELPLAFPVILSGIRLAIIAGLGIATTGVFIGSGGLGMLIWRGIQTRNTIMMLSGAIPVCILALFFDRALAFVEKRLKRHRAG